MKIIVGSTNPVKISATKIGFEKMFPGTVFSVEGVDVDSGVAAQPSSDAETLQGSTNRSNNAKQARPDADYWVGLEGGIEDLHGEMREAAWIYVQSREGITGKGKTGTFIVPPKIASLVKAGNELGQACDIVFGQVNSKHAAGAIGLLTDNVIDRTKFYVDAVIFALVPFKRKELFDEDI